MRRHIETSFLQSLTALWGRLRRGGDAEAWNYALLNVDQGLAQALHGSHVSAVEVSSHTLFQVLDHVLKGGIHRSDCLDILDRAFSCGANANVQHQNSHWDYLLHRASSAGDMEVVALLVRHGADQGARCGNKFTPLECALSGWGELKGSDDERRSVAGFLLKNGSDATLLQGRYNRSILVTALDHVFSQNATNKTQGQALIEALLQHGAPTVWNERRYEKDAAYGDDDTGQGEDARDVFMPALLEIVRSGACTTTDMSWWLRLMRSHGQGVQTQSPGGLNLLQWWMVRNDQDQRDLAATFELLRAEGYDVRAATRWGDTLWHLAVRNPSNDVDAKLTLLMNCPDLADLITTQNADGKTPVDLLEAHDVSGRFPGDGWKTLFGQLGQTLKTHTDHHQISAALDQPQDQPRRALRM